MSNRTGAFPAQEAPLLKLSGPSREAARTLPVAPGPFQAAAPALLTAAGAELSDRPPEFGLRPPAGPALAAKNVPVWWPRWQHLAGECEFQHVQPIGRRPTYLAVAADCWIAGRMLTRELICGGWCWPRMVRDHFAVRWHGGELTVFTGPTLKPAPALAAQWCTAMLPRVREAVERSLGEDRRRARALAAAGSDAWCARQLRGHPPAAAAACVRRAGATLVVAGALEQPEAEELAEVLSREGHWQPERHGSLVVWCGRRGVEIAAAAGEVSPQVRELVRGFCEWVVVSDLHLGVPARDTFGRRKSRVLIRLLDRVVQRRSVLVLNGDFLELLHERYGAIKRAYRGVFARLGRVRRLVYVAGNHDTDVLRERIKQTRRLVRRVALRHVYGEVRVGLDGGLWIEPRGPSRGLHALRAWQRLLRDPAVQRVFQEILVHRQGRVFLSHGFAEAGVAFWRLGPRDTPAEQPHWVLDESLARSRPAPQALLKRLADRRQRLDRVIQAEWGGRVELGRYAWLPARGVYFEHGHAAQPECQEWGWGRWVSTGAGWLKRGGLRQIEHWFEDGLGRWFRRWWPGLKAREQERLVERLQAVASWLRTEQPAGPRLWLVCGHTHEAAHVGAGPVHAALAGPYQAGYANSGAWSSRTRKSRPGADRGEWLLLSAENFLYAHHTPPLGDPH